MATIIAKYRELLNGLKEYSRRDWHQAGYNDGIKHHSSKVYNERIQSISRELSILFADVIDQLREFVHDAGIDVYQAGSDIDLKTISGENKKFWDERLKQCLETAAKDHATDTTSEYHYILLHYRNGFNEGHSLYLKTSDGTADAA